MIFSCVWKMDPVGEIDTPPEIEPEEPEEPVIEPVIEQVIVPEPPKKRGRPKEEPAPKEPAPIEIAPKTRGPKKEPVPKEPATMSRSLQKSEGGLRKSPRLKSLSQRRSSLQKARAA